MKTNDRYSQRKVLKKEASAAYKLIEMAKDWKKIVLSIEESGYDDYLVEYDNDLSVRNTIEIVLNSEGLETDESFKKFREGIFEMDQRLKTCFVPGAERKDGIKWWEKGVLINGTGNYLSDINQIGLDEKQNVYNENKQ